MRRFPFSSNVLAAAAIAVAGVVAGASLAATPVPVLAQGVNLEGSWSGGGQIVFPSGEKERARCRASFRKQGGNSYGMSATCATASAKVQQSAEITHVSGNRYRGEFFNQEFGISGSVRITVHGNSLSASLSGGGGSAEFALSR